MKMPASRSVKVKRPDESVLVELADDGAGVAVLGGSRSDAEAQVAEAQGWEAESEGRPGAREGGAIRGHSLGLAELIAKVTPDSRARKPAPGWYCGLDPGGAQ